MQRYEAGNVSPKELFRRNFMKRLSTNKKWLGIVMICLGLYGALVFANPTANQCPYSTVNLMFIIFIVLAVILISIFVSRQVSSGLVFLVSHWQVWALFISSIVSIIMMQNTYGSGPVAVSQPTMEIVEPIAGLALGIIIFGDSVNLSSGNLLLALVSGAIACVGSRSKRLQAQKL